MSPRQPCSGQIDAPHRRTGRGIGLFAQPLPSVEPALLLAALLEELDDRVLPAFERADFDGLLMMLTSFHVTARMAPSTDKLFFLERQRLARRHRIRIPRGSRDKRQMITPSSWRPTHLFGPPPSLRAARLVVALEPLPDRDAAV